MPLLKDEKAFCLTYGDGVGNVNVRGLIDYHNSHGRLATVTAVQQPPRFGQLVLEDDRVAAFTEKPADESGLINGGYFVLSPEVGRYLKDDALVWEREPLQRLAADRQLKAWTHEGYWQPMDTLRDATELQALWDSGKAPWRVWQ
jgi:glucose-1-phosphate cytidylyltransferase